MCVYFLLWGLVFGRGGGWGGRREDEGMGGDGRGWRGEVRGAGGCSERMWREQRKGEGNGGKSISNEWNGNVKRRREERKR